MPLDGNHKESSIRNELGGLVKLQVLLTLATAAIGGGGLFEVYTFLTAALDHSLHFSNAWKMTFLVIWGLGMVFGNYIGGYLIDKSVDFTVIGSLTLGTVFLVGFSLTMHSAIFLGTVIFMLPATLIAITPALQARLIEVAGEAQTLAASLNHSAFNMANAIGAGLGGFLVVHGYGYEALGWSGAVLSLAGLIIYCASMRIFKIQNLEVVPDFRTDD
ncbi:transporter [Gluconobacter frateurii M-2]|nr:transporter [Gluconobacter frateurii M-2]